MNKEQIMAKIEHSWEDLKNSYANLSNAQMHTPGVTGNWSVKDILAHITTWEEEALKYLPLVIKGDKLPRYRDEYGGIDAFNAIMSQRKGSISLNDTLTQLEVVHQQLIVYLLSVAEEQFASETRFRHRLRLDTYSHYPQHAQAIHNWREQFKKQTPQK